MSVLIKVKDDGSTYMASAPGFKQKASCTAGKEAAARALAVKILDASPAQISTESVGNDGRGLHWFRAEKLAWEGQ